jgi:hypothetical protein
MPRINMANPTARAALDTFYYHLRRADEAAAMHTLPPSPSHDDTARERDANLGKRGDEKQWSTSRPSAKRCGSI